jgi:SpoIID/LytB domain protein
MRRIVDGKWELLVNPFPILPMHFTVPSVKHRPQAIKDMIGEMYRLLADYPELLVFYNGPKCGASAPDHAHLQAGTNGIVPLQRSWQRLARELTPVVRLSADADISVIADYFCPALLIRSHTREDGDQLFRHVYAALPQQADDSEPMMNILGWRHDDEYMLVVIPRAKHRPDCYTAKGDEQVIVSPGALDMAGLLITPREEDFRQLTAEQALSILCEVALGSEDFAAAVARMKETPLTMASQVNQDLLPFGKKEPLVSVGIVSAQQIAFVLNTPYTAKGAAIQGEQVVEFSEGAILWHGQQYRELLFTPQQADASFSLKDVTIGVGFHWERRQVQTFNGSLRLVVESDRIVAINELPVERYLTSVISSEMSAMSSLELLKAHAVISRSWLLAQMAKRRQQEHGTNNFFSFSKKDDELIRWYDREEHTIFDVCADDHCQRYQGITHADNPSVVEAIRQTRGQLLMYGDEICDARFSKCCGGRTEEFQYCWENIPKPYLVSVADPYCRLAYEETLQPKKANGRSVLAQVLNDYDQETTDFYRWTVSYSTAQLTALVNRKLKLDLGDIEDLIPLERGRSGRIWKLKIVGSKRTFTLGKELEIRRALSETHLLSSAFDVEKTANGFRLNGRGWGHGVGLCQIGAAVMGEQGKSYEEILLFYYHHSEIRKIYD